MPADTTLLDATTAGSIFTSMWGVVTDNFAGVAVLLGAVVGLSIAAKLINGAKKGKVKV